MSLSSPVPTYTAGSAAWWKDAGVRKLVLWQVCILISQMTTGYDEVVVGSFQSMKPWVADMGHPNSSRLGLITAVVFIGGFAGAFIASPIIDRFGRRAGMLVGSTTTCVGTVLQAAAQESDMFIVGRLLIGMGISFTCIAGPALLFELAHPRMRGTITSSFNVLWYLGSIIAAWTCFGTGHMLTSWSWRIPSIIQGLPSLFVALSVVFGLPESPRWLYAKGRPEEARKILGRYHANGDETASIVESELSEIDASVAAGRIAKAQGWSILWRTSANRKRVGVVIAVALLTLWNGQGVISYYFSPILTSIGITSTTSQTGINGGLQIWNLICAMFGALLADRIGRRPLWLLSFIGMILANVPLTVASAMYANHGSKAAAYTVVVFLFLYDAAFNLANNPLLYGYPPELLTYPMRAKGMGVQIAVSEAALTINQYVNPIALDHIGYNYFIFYLGMLILGTAIIYFTFPETKGKTEEELATLFEDSVTPQRTLEGTESGKEPAAIDEKMIGNITSTKL
ncbi:hypothetical protein A1O1_00008 [Capronia coronata CBS 617.96]|uniref:Major facilitator superfamily (MFS) profile domain-containing protein n=1 Tax=Capronia coronata CBS 617.96 TaxID=1182541 RepID=W9YYZ8_9EURO|nr:uncharacterized protein A1O1_00008 [Capronia coronata CBS 617.96]EXJ94890.1 hypothetical protein A1O1_00008 [Capronia coronata CBS 617.96]